MLKLENTEVMGWEAAIRGMRNPKNSWEKSDTQVGCAGVECKACPMKRYCDTGSELMPPIVGSNDHTLMMQLRNAGTDHRKFMRMIVVYVDITAPLYWWKEFDTYKVGTVANSCSTMHKIHAKEFTLEDFSHEHLIGSPIPNFEKLAHVTEKAEDGNKCYSFGISATPCSFMEWTIGVLNAYRKLYIETKDKRYWWQMIQLLPSSYNQRRTVMLNYEVLANMYKSRKAHKLNEWLDFCEWIRDLPYSKIITGEEADK